jgi:23S rRNA (adenine2503-C2)-methyltransferase
MLSTQKIHFLEYSRTDWENWFSIKKAPSFRAKQLGDWIYTHLENRLENMTNLPASIRQMLAEEFDFSLPNTIQVVHSADNTTKLLIEAPGQVVSESVIMRYDERTTLCVSSQVGCKLACTFCQTGKLGFVKHLPASFILAQYFLAAQITKAEGRRLSHVVYMGMGEPFDNYEATIVSCNRLIDAAHFGLSKRHVTVSTSGIAPKIYAFTDECDVALAVSLHAANDQLRSRLMPINNRYPLAELKAALRHYQNKTGKTITIEYILIEGQNTGIEHARELIQFLQGIQAKVNLIPFNEHPGLNFKRPSSDTIRTFQEYLSKRSVAAPVRYSRGLEVSAACGQLAAKERADLFQPPVRKNVKRDSHPQAQV